MVGWPLRQVGHGRLAPKQVGDGRLASKTGGKWEIHPSLKYTIVPKLIIIIIDKLHHHITRLSMKEIFEEILSVFTFVIKRV